MLSTQSIRKPTKSKVFLKLSSYFVYLMMSGFGIDKSFDIKSINKVIHDKSSSLVSIAKF